MSPASTARPPETDMASKENLPYKPNKIRACTREDGELGVAHKRRGSAARPSNASGRTGPAGP